MECEVLTTTEDCSSSENEEDDYPGLSKMSRVFQQHWKETRENPHHFNVWTKLVAYAESEKSLAACRKAYDAFLEKYPLCHIYWKKYIEVEQRLGNAKDAEKVFDRALKSQPYNVVMWVHYIHFLKQNMDMTLKESADKLRSVFQEAVKLCGLDFYSDELWQLYIDFETEQGNLKDAASLYDRVLFVPTQQYLTHYARFKKFISTYSPLDFLAKEECTWVYSTIQEESDANQVASEDADDLSEFVTDSDKAKIVGQILKVREQLCILNKAEVVKRVPFEDTIKRRHFYAAPLNIKQLTIWRKYLEFEVSQGQHERIVLLYERCLMPCAFYEEFWLTYAQYMENKSVEAARGIFERACRINFPQKYILHVQWAAFEEKHGCLESARGILREAEKALPNLAILRLKRVALERRNGNLLEAEKLLMEAKQNSTDVKLSSFYATKLSRLILTLQGDLHKARSVLTDAIQKDPVRQLKGMSI
ncbi:pre-mRNA-processing factor 39-like [Gastrophryne carolinensis]